MKPNILKFMILTYKSILQRNVKDRWIRMFLIFALFVGMTTDIHAKDKVRNVKVGFFDFKGYHETDNDGTVRDMVMTFLACCRDMRI